MKQQKIKVVVVDDENEAREVMQSLLEAMPEVELAGCAHDAHDAYTLITQAQPDIAFLDIRMPIKTGIELAKELIDQKIKASIVFVTAYEEYAIQAIKLAAFDFLLKPVNPDELHEVIKKYRNTRHDNHQQQRLEKLLRQLNHDGKIRFNTRNGFIVVEPTEIICVEADGNYSKIVFSKSRQELVTINLGILQEMLAGNNFFRASRSSLINLMYLSRVERKCRRCELIKHGEIFTITISREQMSLFNEVFR